VLPICGHLARQAWRAKQRKRGGKAAALCLCMLRRQVKHTRGGGRRDQAENGRKREGLAPRSNHQMTYIVLSWRGTHGPQGGRRGWSIVEMEEGVLHTLGRVVFGGVGGWAAAGAAVRRAGSIP
jgi:hypothetical protein